jgi:hypothetical protein
MCPPQRLPARIELVNAYARLIELLPSEGRDVEDSVRFTRVMRDVHQALDKLADAYGIPVVPSDSS